MAHKYVTALLPHIYKGTRGTKWDVLSGSKSDGMAWKYVSHDTDGGSYSLGIFYPEVYAFFLENLPAVAGCRCYLSLKNRHVEVAEILTAGGWKLVKIAIPNLYGMWGLPTDLNLLEAAADFYGLMALQLTGMFHLLEI